MFAAAGGERTDSLEPSVRTSCSTSIAQTHSSDLHAGLATRAAPHSVKMGSRQPKGACFWAPEDNVKSHVSPWASVCSMVPAVHLTFTALRYLGWAEWLTMLAATCHAC